MLTPDELYNLAKRRFEEAKILLANKMPDGACYLCGYSLELMLKRKITLHLDWTAGFPEVDGEFKNKTSFKTHDLTILLHLSGLEQKLKSDPNLHPSWQIAKSWQVEQRYTRVGYKSHTEATSTIDETRKILNWLLKQ